MRFLSVPDRSLRPRLTPYQWQKGISNAFMRIHCGGGSDVYSKNSLFTVNESKGGEYNLQNSLAAIIYGN